MSNSLASKLHKILSEVKMAGKAGLPMLFRLFGFFLLFLITVMLGVMIILVATGTFKAGQRENREFLEYELTDLSETIYRDYGSLSVRAVELASSLSINLERNFNEHELSAERLQAYPELLEVFLEEELVFLTAALEKARSSGVFLILDATVNPEQDGAEFSRAGLFIKNMEPNIVQSSFTKMSLLRGPMQVARKNNIDVLPQWEMEFAVEGMEQFYKTIQTAESSELPLSRLYYWSYGPSIANRSESAMHCSVPLIDSQGQVFGICGFEVSSMLFKLSYSPNHDKYNNIFCIFSTVVESRLRVKDALFSGNNYPRSLSIHPLVVNNSESLTTYRQNNSVFFAGLHRNISMYPKDSAYQEQWVFAVMMPEEELIHLSFVHNRQLLLLLVMLMVVSIGISFIVSMGYIKPVVAALDMIKADKLSQVPKTRIPEIDDLIKFLAEQEEGGEPDPGTMESQPSLFSEFLKNIETLSKAERAVFNLYLKGYTAKEIAGILWLSINTIKTHNKRIYMKLNVSSRQELMLYIQMLKEQNEI